MDLKAIKELAARRPAVWLDCVLAWAGDSKDAAPAFGLQTRRASLLDIDKISREANDLSLVDGLVHAVCNEQRLVKAYLDLVIGWRGVQVKHILAPAQIEGSDYAASDVVPFDRDLLDALLANYPVLVKDLTSGIFKAAFSHASDLEISQKN